MKEQLTKFQSIKRFAQRPETADMTLKPLKLDVATSKEVFLNCDGHVEPKMCYNNVFNVTLHNDTIYQAIVDGSIRIAYGYMTIPNSHVAVRHCFFVDQFDAVIDVTQAFLSDGMKEADYFIVKEFSDIDSYIEAISNENREPALYRTLAKEFDQYEAKLNEDGYICLI